MEEKKAKVLQQLQQMKDVSKQHIEDGIPFFVMHANCAIEFADLVMELLNAGANLKEGEVGKPIQIEIRCVDRKENYQTKAALVVILGKDENPEVHFITRECTVKEEFLMYVVSKHFVEKMEKDNIYFAEIYEEERNSISQHVLRNDVKKVGKEEE